jgi:hypothetical protein
VDVPDYGVGRIDGDEGGILIEKIEASHRSQDDRTSFVFTLRTALRLHG